jgi:hypothetical protein
LLPALALLPAPQQQQQQFFQSQQSTEQGIQQLKADGEVMAWAPWPDNSWTAPGPITLQEVESAEASAASKMSPSQQQQANQLAAQFTNALTAQNSENLAQQTQTASEMLQQFTQLEQQNAPTPAPQAAVSSSSSTTSSENNTPAPLSAQQLLTALPQGGAQALQSALQASSEAVQAETNAAANAANEVEQALEAQAQAPSPPPPSVVSLLQTLPQQQAAQLGQLVQQQQQQVVSTLEQDLADNQNAPAPGPAPPPIASSTDGLSSSEALWISSEVGAPANAVLAELTPAQLQSLQQLAQTQSQQLQASEANGEEQAAIAAPAPAPSSEGNYQGLGATEWGVIDNILKSGNAPVPTVTQFMQSLTPEQQTALQTLAQQAAVQQQQVSQQVAAAQQQVSTGR